MKPAKPLDLLTRPSEVLPPGGSVGLGWTSVPPAESATGTIRAAGALVWRRREQLEVLVVHRPKYDDWSWPKGKLDAGESWAGACVREVLEETGLAVTLGVPLPDATYDVGSNGTTRSKVVRYWAARPVGGSVDSDLRAQNVDEVDELAWLSIDEAALRVDYQRDLEQLQALAAADAMGRLDTWPLAVVRHAKSVPRSRWKGSEQRRPLTDAGRSRAAQIVPVLSAYAFSVVASSPSARCTATIQPFAREAGSRVRLRDGLSEEGFADDPSSAVSVITKLLARGEPAAVCSHRPVLPALLATLADRCADPTVAQALLESAGPGLVKGEVLVAHVVDQGADASVVAVERHDTR